MQTQRHIRSFVLRAGRTTAAQDRALTELWPTYGLDFGDSAMDLDVIFGRRAPRCLEIGFGIGEVIGSLAENNPHIDYLGIEVHRAGIGRLLLRADQGALRNLRVICHDAVEVLRHGIANESVDEVLVFFPDPWHKKRHHKRRLIEPAFVASVATKLRSGGVPRHGLASLCGTNVGRVQCEPRLQILEHGRDLRAEAGVQTAHALRKARCSPGSRRVGSRVREATLVAGTLFLNDGEPEQKRDVTDHQ
jgi:tRNA G46 methylase TrmB